MVLLDEPFAALDASLRTSLREEVASILRAAGASALLVTHDQQEALSLADVVVVMRDGAVEQIGSPEDLYDHPVSRWVAEFLGTAEVLTGEGDGSVVHFALGTVPAPGTAPRRRRCDRPAGVAAPVGRGRGRGFRPGRGARVLRTRRDRHGGARRRARRPLPRSGRITVAPRPAGGRHRRRTGHRSRASRVNDRRRTGLVVGGCVALSALALLLPATLAYDPWAWLMWGREIAHLDLDTTGGPSWKPLPMVITTPLAVARRPGPDGLAGRGPHRRAPRARRRLPARRAAWPDRWPAGSPAGFLVLTPDGGPRFVRLVLEGHSAPWTAAFALWAVDQHLAGRHRRALALVTLLAWDRPEAWPFLLVYGVWLARAEPAARWLAVTALVSVPILWFGADWWGSGSPLHGADAAQVYSDEPGRLGIAFEHGAKVVLAPVWVLSLVGGGLALARRDRTVAALLGMAIAWMGLVVGMNGGARVRGAHAVPAPGRRGSCASSPRSRSSGSSRRRRPDGPAAPSRSGWWRCAPRSPRSARSACAGSTTRWPTVRAPSATWPPWSTRSAAQPSCARASR